MSATTTISTSQERHNKIDGALTTRCLCTGPGTWLSIFSQCTPHVLPLLTYFPTVTYVTELSMKN